MVLVALRILNVTESPGIYVGGLAFAVLTGGLLSLRDVWFAYWGLATKQRALRAVDENLGEEWALRTDRMSPAGGDIDALVTHKRDAKAYAIEIKSFGGVEVKPSLFSGAPRWQYRNGRPLSKKRDPFPQTLRNAQAVGAVPILWLPNTRGRKGGQLLSNGVLLVADNAKRLTLALERHVSRS